MAAQLQRAKRRGYRGLWVKVRDFQSYDLDLPSHKKPRRSRSAPAILTAHRDGAWPNVTHELPYYKYLTGLLPPVA